MWSYLLWNSVIVIIWQCVRDWRSLVNQRHLSELEIVSYTGTVVTVGKKTMRTNFDVPYTRFSPISGSLKKG